MRQLRAGVLTVAGLGLWAVTMSVPVGAAPSGKKLTLNGKVASNNVQTMNGQAFVSLADLAKTLGMVMVKNADGSYEIKQAGGTFQAGDLYGKIGDVLFDGKWRLQVLSVQTPESFPMSTAAQPYGYDNVATYDAKTRLITPQAGSKLVVIKVRVTNGQKTPQTLWTAISDKTMRTALTDTAGGSHPPIDYDYAGAPTVTLPLLPGAAMTFPIIFSVPQDTVLKDLVMTLKNNDSFAKGNDARIALTP